MPTPPTGCLCRQCPPSEQNVKAASAGVSPVAWQGAVAPAPRLVGGWRWLPPAIDAER